MKKLCNFWKTYVILNPLPARPPLLPPPRALLAFFSVFQPSSLPLCLSSLAKHRVTSAYLFSKFGIDTAENEPAKKMQNLENVGNIPTNIEAADVLLERTQGPDLGCFFNFLYDLLARGGNYEQG